MNTPTQTTFSQKNYPEHYLIFILMGGFLLVDSLVGFIEIYLGIHLKVSLVYKSPVLLFILAIIALRDIRFFMIILTAILLFLVGPTIKLIQINDTTSFFFDITTFLKILSPILYMKYFLIVADEDSNLLLKYGPKIMLFNYSVILLNMILGIMGFGYATYGGTSDTGNLGVIGFFSGGNELGAVFIVLSAYFMVITYKKSTLAYLMFCVLTLSAGILISTKTSILSAVLLSIFIPVTMNRKGVFRLTIAKFVFASIFIIISTYLAIVFVDILKSSGFWQRIVWFYDQYGLIRVIFSGREVFVRDLLAIYAESDWYEVLFGLSNATLNNFWLPLKTSAEIDPVDVVITFGLVGLIVAAIIQLFLFISAFKLWKLNNRSVASAGLLSLILLEALAFTSGHIWLSGMLGPFLGLVIGLSYEESRKRASVNFPPKLPAI
jgi:hypothetical protein